MDHPFNLASHHNRRLIMQKAVRHRRLLYTVRMIVGKWFQVLFTPVSGVLFTFPSTVLGPLIRVLESYVF